MFQRRPCCKLMNRRKVVLLREIFYYYISLQGNGWLAWKHSMNLNVHVLHSDLYESQVSLIFFGKIKVTEEDSFFA
jgi:hypothetical protein